MTPLLALLQSKAARRAGLLVLVALWMAWDLSYHARIRNQRDAALLQVQKEQLVISGFEQIAQEQATRQAAAVAAAAKVGAKTQAIVQQIQAGPQPKTAEDVRKWLIAQGKEVVR